MTTNVLSNIGFVPMRNKFVLGGAMNEYTISSSYTGLMGIGDLVRQNTSGNIVKCLPNETPIGIFQGWNFATRALGGGSQGGTGNDGSVPWKKAWTGAQVVPTNMAIRCLVDDDPAQTFRVQAKGTITAAQRGLLVDLADAAGGPDTTLFGRSKQMVGTPTTYYNITAISVDGGTAGSGFTQDGVDLLVNGDIQDIRPSDITVTAGAVTAVTLLNAISGVPTNSPTITVQAKPGYSGTVGAGTFTPTVSGAQTANQFRIERVLEQPFRAYDSSNNTTGYDLSVAGAKAWVEVAYARHMRGGTALYGAPAA
jgi:hypothetical protein